MKLVKLFRQFLPLAMVIVFAILATLPLFRSGFIPTHDGEYHIIRFFEFKKMLLHRYWFPRWAPGLNSGYGVPLFNFHYPLPNYFGVLYHSLGFSLTDAFKLTLASGYLLAIASCFFWLNRFFSKWTAASATVVFSFVPYWFVDIYVRGSVGEVLATGWLMLALASMEKDWDLLAILASAGIILSHNILALVYLPVLFLYFFLRKTKYPWYLLASLGLTAYFWLPALAEQKFVIGLSSVNFRDYFPKLYQLLIPSWGTGFSGTGFLNNEMSPQIGLVTILVTAASFFFVFTNKFKRINYLAKYFLILIALAFFLMQEASLFIWEKATILNYLQYPWRLLSLFLPSTAFLSAYFFFRIKKWWMITLVVLTAVYLSYPYSRPVVYAARDDNYYLGKREFTDGTSSLGNSFSTRWSTWKNERPKDKIEVIAGWAVMRTEAVRPLRYEFLIAATEPSSIRVNTLYYPGWRVEVDGQQQTIDYNREGLINFNVPAGIQRIIVWFGETPLRLLADGISIISLLWLGGSVILRLIRHEYSFGRLTTAKRA